MNIKSLFLITLSFIFSTGCSYKTSEEIIDMSPKIEEESVNFQSASLEKTKMEKTKIEKVSKRSELIDFYSKWKGVKYKFGGESQKGIDCSAFIQKAFREKFDLEMPRTTRLQATIGKQIEKNKLKIGDLVFFRSGRDRHVGIYLDDGKFMHASTKKGVTISNLDNVYFSKNYWKAQRVID